MVKKFNLDPEDSFIKDVLDSKNNTTNDLNSECSLLEDDFFSDFSFKNEENKNDMKNYKQSQTPKIETTHKEKEINIKPKKYVKYSLDDEDFNYFADDTKFDEESEIKEISRCQTNSKIEENNEIYFESSNFDDDIKELEVDISNDIKIEPVHLNEDNYKNSFDFDEFSSLNDEYDVNVIKKTDLKKNKNYVVDSNDFDEENCFQKNYSTLIEGNKEAYVNSDALKNQNYQINSGLNLANKLEKTKDEYFNSGTHKEQNIPINDEFHKTKKYEENNNDKESHINFGDFKEQVSQFDNDLQITNSFNNNNKLNVDIIKTNEQNDNLNLTKLSQLNKFENSYKFDNDFWNEEEYKNQDEEEVLDLPTIVLRNVFKLDNFRTNQKEIIKSSLEKQDVFVLMPTGGGKSITFQLPALIEEGITLVISPLLSLIQDQVQSLLNRNIIALSISSQLSISEKNLIFEIMQRKPLLCKIFYVTPELIVKSTVFQHILENVQISRIVIDEAHCVSQWGHDFRPDYKEVGNIIRDIFKDQRVPLIALTATASPKVESDVINNLNMKNVKIFRMSFNRPNLLYYVHKKTKSIDIDIVTFISSYYPDSCGIIYCTSKKECEMLSERFNDRYDLKTRFYHAGLSKNERVDVQNKWNEGHFKIIIATIAFGMGIDKKDVRFVIHYSLPKSLEGYYQETGRAGRDGLESVCHLFYSYADKKILEFLIDKGSNGSENKRRQKEELRNVIQYCENLMDCRRVQVLLHFGENFDSNECKATCDNCLKIKGNRTCVDLTEHAKNLYNLVM